MLVDHLAQSKVKMYHSVTPCNLHICHADLMFSFQLWCSCIYLYRLWAPGNPLALAREEKATPRLWCEMRRPDMYGEVVGPLNYRTIRPRAREGCSGTIRPLLVLPRYPPPLFGMTSPWHESVKEPNGKWAPILFYLLSFCVKSFYPHVYLLFSRDGDAGCRP